MGKLFGGFGSKKNHKKNRQTKELDWIDYDEDMDDADEIDEDEDFEDDEEIYEDDDIDEDEVYEDDDIDEEEEIYEDDEEVYEDDDIDEDEDYEDDDIDEDEDYEDDDIDEDYEDEDDEPTGIAAVIAKIKGLSLVDHIVMITGAAVLVLAVITGSLYAGAKLTQKQVATFAEIGTGAENITVIGESGLLAIADAQASKLAAAEIEEEPQEEEAQGEIEVTLVMTSIQKDLKIKFTNAKTGKLIPNMPFEVEVTDSKNATSTWKDDDKDGIIYKTDIVSGKYTVTMKALEGQTDYKISTAPVSVTVKDTIEYKKVDIADEVKTESQVNVAVEDTAVNQTTVESTNTDTVEWVESTKTLIEGTEKNEEGYTAVKKDTITDPNKTASSAMLLFGSGVQMFSTEGENDPIEPTANPTADPTAEPTQEPTAEPTKDPTQEPTVAPTATPTPAATTAPTPSKAPTTAPTATPTSTAKPSTAPTTTPTATPAASATPSTTPSATPKATATATPKTTPNPTTELKDNSGNRVYYKDSNGNYVAATYADYSKYSEFYIKTTKTTGEYTYTGWQTLDGKTYFFDKNGNRVTGDQVIQGAKYSFASDGALNTSSGHMGIDVSKWNGNIDWNAVKNSGVSYVIIRCGYRGSTTGALIEDPKFKSNISGATAAGLKVGVYFFTQATNEVEAVEEASMAVSLIKGYKISYPVFLDVESANGGRADSISQSARTAVCKAFCQTVQNSGYTAGVYANKTWFTSYINAGSLTSYKLWLAQYAATPTYTATKYDLWQYSSKGSVAGISGNVDMNISYLGY